MSVPYNDWLAKDFCAKAPNRLIGIAQMPATGVQDAIAEMRRALDMGLRGVLVSSWPSGNANVSEADDPFFAEAQKRGVPVSLHIGLVSRAKVAPKPRTPVDVDKAKEVLEDAGYTWNSGALTDPDGEPVEFSISVPAGWSDWNTEQQLISEELDKALGIKVNVDQPDFGGWDAGKQEGDFDAIIHWLEDTGNAYGLYTSTMDPKWIVDGKAAFNFGRFDDPKVTEALNTYANAASDEERAEAGAVLQKAFVENVPAIPLGAHPLLGEFNTRNYVGWPSEDDQYAAGDPTQVGVVQILTKLKPKE